MIDEEFEDSGTEVHLVKNSIVKKNFILIGFFLFMERFLKLENEIF